MPSDMLPRVSSILSIIFTNSLQFVEEEHLERGTFLHEQMELYVNDQIYGHDGDIHPDIEGAVEWLKSQDIIFESAEEQISHKYGYTGRPDALVLWNGKPYWFDWKFSLSITLQNRMQGSAYCKLTGRPGAFIQCDRKGKVKVKRYKPEPALWAVFISALNVLKFQLARRIV